MPWSERDRVSLRREFLELSRQHGCCFAELCRRFGISRNTGYKWKRRLEHGQSLKDNSRRPKTSPDRTDTATEQRVVELRMKYPVWGGRKLRKILQREGHESVPAASTVTDILRRHNLIGVEQSEQRVPWQRFERRAPNDLWQMDFKGHFDTGEGRCNPLTVLDDHSRYALGVRACANQETATVQSELTAIFRRYGLPRTILTDNGPPWGNSCRGEYTELGVWLLRLRIKLIHGRPYHPQTQGKDERLHRTLKEEVLDWRLFADLAHCQKHFDAWNHVYNWERPHEALDLEVPGKRYQSSPHSYPEELPSLEYDAGLEVRRVSSQGQIRFKSKSWLIGKSFVGLEVALRATSEDDIFEILFGPFVIKKLDVREQPE
jgi:transposase InsO family protein